MDSERVPQPLLSVRSIVKRVDALTILNDLSFELFPGEIVGLIGPNGAGKTTLMRVLAGLYEASSGSAKIQGAELGASSARRALSLMPEDPDLYPGLSVIEHILLLDRLNSVGGRSAAPEELLARYGLSDKIDALPHELSQGMRRKLALILALRKGASLFLFDEPFNGLDPVAARELKTEISRLAAAGNGVLLCMHGLRELEEIADRAIVLVGGKILRIIDIRDRAATDTSTLEDIYLDLVRLEIAGS